MAQTTDQYFKDFFNEKSGIEEFNYTTVKNGQVWDFNYTKDDMLKIILSMPNSVKKTIQKKFIQIDFANGNINKFLEYVMLGYARGQIK